MKKLIIIGLILLSSTAFAQSRVSGNASSPGAVVGVQVFSAWFNNPTDAALQTGCGFSDIVRSSKTEKFADIKTWCPDVIIAYYDHSMRGEYQDDESTVQGARWDEIKNDEDLFHHSEGAIGQGTHTSATPSSTVLTDTGQSWSKDWTDYRIVNTTDGSTCLVTSSTSTTITCSGGLEDGSDNTWQQNDTYAVDRIQGGVNYRFAMDEGNTDWADKLIEWSNNLTADADQVYFDICQPRWPTFEFAEQPSDYSGTVFETEKKASIDRFGAGINRFVSINSLHRIFAGATETTPIDWFANVQGTQSENFVYPKNTSTFVKADAETDMGDIISVRDIGRQVFVLTRPNPTDTDTRLNIVVLYLLIQFEKSYLCINDGSEALLRLTWFPEYDVNIGYATETHANVAAMEHDTNFWRRTYTGGEVVFNHSGSAQDYTFSGSKSKAVISGGGDVADNGDLPSGNLTWTSVSSPLSIASESGVILKND